jgi:hypothetical protein
MDRGGKNAVKNNDQFTSVEAMLSSDEFAQAKAFLERAEEGDASTLPLIRRILEQTGDEGIKFFCGDSAFNTKLAMVNAVAGKNLVARQAMLKKIEQVERDLAGPNPTPIERYTAERATLCWFAAHEADATVYVPRGEIPHSLWKMLIRRQESANRRFLAAMRTLASVRKVPRRAVQINGQNQVNLAGPDTSQRAKRRGGRRKVATARRNGTCNGSNGCNGHAVKGLDLFDRRRVLERAGTLVGKRGGD